MLYLSWPWGSSSKGWRKYHLSSRWWRHLICRTSAVRWWPWGSSSSPGGGSQCRSWLSSGRGCSWFYRRPKVPASSFHDAHAASQTTERRDAELSVGWSLGHAMTWANRVFSQMHNIGNIGINTNFVFQYIYSFLLSLHHVMLVYVKVDTSGYKRIAGDNISIPVLRKVCEKL